MDCSICGAPLGAEAASCKACGAPTDDRADAGEKSQCALCDGLLWSLVEACVHCGGKGYPALRPRLGDKSLGAPDGEVNA
jgi:hypothetical protein